MAIFCESVGEGIPDVIVPNKSLAKKTKAKGWNERCAYRQAQKQRVQISWLLLFNEFQIVSDRKNGL